MLNLHFFISGNARLVDPDLGLRRLVVLAIQGTGSETSFLGLIRKRDSPMVATPR